MLAKSKTCAVVGLDGYLVEVEVDISPGLPAFTIVGLPDTAVQESRERVRSAIRNSGFEFPMRRITVNLAPADLRKAGPAYDLPIAVGVLLSSGQVTDDVANSLFLGELSLDGSLRRTRAILSMVAVGREQGLSKVYVPVDNASEASLVEGMDAVPVHNLAELAGHLRGELELSVFCGEQYVAEKPGCYDTSGGADVDIGNVRGQDHAKRALEVAAAGAHNLLLVGPPGGGKTLLAPGDAHYPAFHDQPRGLGGNQDIQCRRHAAHVSSPDIEPALPIASLHHLQRRTRRRRPLAQARRNHPRPPRSPILRRASGIWPLGSGVVAPALGGPHRIHQPGPRKRDFSGEFYAGRCHEPMSLRISRRPEEKLHLRAFHDR